VPAASSTGISTDLLIVIPSAIALAAIGVLLAYVKRRDKS
jgi:hypothetical protein